MLPFYCLFETIMSESSNTIQDFWKHISFSVSISLLWFLKSIPILGGEGNWFVQLWRTFFVTSEPEVLLGEGVDVLGSFWMIHNVKDMMLFRNDTFFEELYYPVGFDLGMHTGFAWMDAIVSVPLALIMDVPGYYNLHVYLTCVISFFSLTWLFRSMGLHLYHCFALGTIGYFHAFTFFEINLGRPTQVTWWPLCWLLGLALKQQRLGFTNRDGVMTGFAFALACLTYWFSAAAMGFTLILIFCILLFQYTETKQALGSVFRSVAVSVGIVVLLTHRVSIPILLGQYSDDNMLSQVIEPHYDLVKTSTLNIKMNSLFVVNSFEELVQMIDMSLFHVPLMIFAGICIFLPFNTKAKLPWSVGMVVSLGYPIASAIEIGFWRIPTGLFFLEKFFPPMIRCHFMNRMMVVGHLLALIVIALTIKDMMDRKRFSKTVRFYLIPMGLVFFSGISFPILAKSYSTVFVAKQKSATILKENPGAVIEIPIDAVNESYVQQIFHQQSLFWGPGADSIRPPKHVIYQQKHPVIDVLDEMIEAKPSQKASITKEDLNSLYNDGFRWIVFHQKDIQNDAILIENALDTSCQMVVDEGLFLCPISQK